MAKRVPAKLITLLIVLAGSLAVAEQAPLVSYDFDDDLLQSGPDTFQVFMDNGRKVSLSYEMAHSGAASIHLTDLAGDRDFVEFQGYFEPQDSGVLSMEFSFLMTDTDGAFSMALTGRKKYRLDKNGLNFWLTYDGVWLRSYSNSIPKKLFQPATFQWYTVRADLHLEDSVYDLRITDEYSETVYLGESLVLAPGRHATHSVQEYSFVGDIYDQAPADFFIDSFQITSSTRAGPVKLVAPGRKTLFVDKWNHYQSTVHGTLRCLPAIDFNDLAINDLELADIFKRNEMQALVDLTTDPHQQPTDIRQLHPKLQALAHWRASCEQLGKDKGLPGAAESIEQALANAPDAYIYRLSDIIIRSKDLDPAELLYAMSDLRTGDIRSEIALSMIAAGLDATVDGFYAPELSSQFGQHLLDLSPTDRILLARDPTAMAVDQIEAFMAEDWEAYFAWAVAMEFQYLALLGRGNLSQASQLAGDMTDAMEALQLPAYLWLERRGDTALLLQQPQQAVMYYEEARSGTGPGRLDLKLSDAFYLMGDHDRERALRESIYRNFAPE